MKIVVLGAGSIGMHVAAQLHMAGQHVTLIGRTQQQVEELTIKGLTYKDYEGKIKLLQIPAISETEADMPFDVVIVTLKQTHLHSARNVLSRLALYKPKVVCLQNGLGHDEFFAREFPMLPLLLAVTTEGALKERANAVRHTGKGTTWVGPATAHALDAMTLVVELFAGSQMKVVPDLQIYEKIWKKLVVNACINPLTAIFRVRNGQLIESAAALAIMERIYMEAKQVGTAVGIAFEHELWQEVLAVCRNTSENKSSMLQDVEAGRATEIEYINGALKRQAERHGISVPSNDMVIDMVIAVQDWERKKRGAL